MRYEHSTVGTYRGKRVWKFLPRNYRTKDEAKKAGEAQKKKYGYLYKIQKAKGKYRNQLTGGYRLYVMAPQTKSL